jgi:folate-binding protein YgfZ
VSATAGDEVAALRAGAGLFFATGPSGRGLVEVTGSDARRWLDGMVSNDVASLEASSPRSGCYAALLTPKGRIVADLHVLARRDGFWLETTEAAIPAVLERLERYIVADDVKLADRSSDVERLALEGARAEAVLERASGSELGSVAACSWCALEVAGVSLTAARFGWSGEDAFQLFLPAGSRDRVVDALRKAGSEIGSEEGTRFALVLAGKEAFEILRIEAGTPWLGAELDEEVLPDEARLDLAISRSKGCYIGQEIVARVHARGAVNHLLVGLRFPDAELPERDTPLFSGERRTGEVTSVCISPAVGTIGLGYVRREHATPGTELRAGSAVAQVAELPFAQPGAYGEA